MKAMERKELLRWAEEEIKKENREEALLLKGEILAHHNSLIIIGCLLANIVLAALFPNYMVAWIAASFFLYLLAPIVMLIPTEGGKDFIPSREALDRYISIVRDYEIVKDTKTLGHVIWNTFFINSQSLAIGYCTIFSIDIVFSFISGFSRGNLPQGTAIQVILQSIAIVIFFAAIWKFKPYTPQFIDSIHHMHNRLQKRMKDAWKIVLALGAISAGVSLLVVMAMLLPGFVLGEVVKAPDAVNAITAFPIALIFTSQLAVLRYLQGVYSKDLALRFMSGKIRSLQKIVGELGSLREQGDPANPSGEQAVVTPVLDELWRQYVRTKIYTTKRHSLFGYLPVYMVVPDFSMLMSDESLQNDDWFIPVGDSG